MPYLHDIDRCFAESIGDGGVPRAAYEAALARTGAALDWLRQAHGDGSLPLLLLPAARDDLVELEAIAARWRARFQSVVVFGTGGSSLGGQTLTALADRGFGPPAGCPRLIFLDNIDPDSFAAAFENLDFAATGFIAISKSGGTPETLTQLLTLLPRLEVALGGEAIGDHVLVITEAADNPLRRLAARHGFTCLEHDPAIGGRYSALSLVGLLPALIAGLDAGAVRAGAASVLDPILAGAGPADCPPAQGAALNIAALDANAIASHVLMPYLDRLATFGAWYRQLWAESVGKDGRGTTPIRALGTVDQHSQLQLYLAGPADKLYSLIWRAAPDAAMPALADPGDPALAYLAGRTMGELLVAEQRATADVLAANGRPVRVIEIERVDEHAMGALMMHFMLETIIAARLFGVDPFDQPAVEAGKVLARKYLAGSA